MHHAFKRAALCTALAAMLAACGGDGDGGGGNNGGGGGGSSGGGGGAGTLQSQFGSVFEAAFNQPATAEPVAVTASSLGPVSFTTDPIPVP